MYASQKYTTFANEPIGQKSVKLLPEIGEILDQRLINNGIDKANMVLGYFLQVEKDEKLFADLA